MSAAAPDPPPEAATLARLTRDWSAPTIAPGGDDTLPVPENVAVPGYEVLGELGRGGMGVVYRARHVGLNRVVALKMVLAGQHAGASSLARFRSEAEAVARLQHPNVVQVYDIGEAGGLPFLSLELCAGTLEGQLDGTPWLPRRAAELIEVLARAVHAAHQAGVVHRDLKPANVLLAADGTPKITDFGLAKRLDGSGAGPTATGAILGTPSYMAPEQAGQPSAAGPQSGAPAIGPATDIYALGAVLYELLTGRPPFKAATPLDTLLQVAHDEPVAPARLAPKTPRDLQTICLMCLAKEPARRYPSADALADDLRRFLDNEPIRARPVPRWERAVKWGKRRPALAALVAVSATALVALFGGGLYFTDQLRAERDAARRAESVADENAQKASANARRAEAEMANGRRQNYVLAMGQAQLAWQQSAVGRLRNVLAAQVPPAGEDDLRDFEWYYWDRRARGAPRVLRLDGPSPFAEAVAYSPDGRWLAAAAHSGRVFLWDAATGQLARTLKADMDLIHGLAFSPDGRTLAVAAHQSVHQFEVATGTHGRVIRAGQQVDGVAFHPAGDCLAVKADNRVQFWDAAGGVRSLTLKAPNSYGAGVAFSPDGRRVAAGGFPGKVWDSDTGEGLRTLAGGTHIAFSPDGRRIALIDVNALSRAAEIRVVDSTTGAVLFRCQGHTEDCRGVCFSPDGRWLASAGDDNTVRLWDADTGKERRRFKGLSHWNTGVCFSPDGRTLAAAGGDAVELWPVNFEQEATTRKAHTAAGTQSLALHADTGRVLGNGLFIAMIDDATTHRAVALEDGRFRVPTAAAFSPDGRMIAAGFPTGGVGLWDVATSKRLHMLSDLRHSRPDVPPALAAGLLDPQRPGRRGYPRPGLTNALTALAFSGDGRRLAAAGQSTPDRPGSAPGREGPPGHVAVWDTATGAKLLHLRERLEQVNALALSGDGRLLLTGSGRLTARLWDATTGRLLYTLGEQPEYSGWETVVALSGDGRWAAYGPAGLSAIDGRIQLYDTTTGRLAHSLDGHLRGLCKLVFSPDGRRLASASDDDTVKLWDVATGQEVLSRPVPPNVVDLGFTHDGRQLLAVTIDGTLRVWDARP